MANSMRTSGPLAIKFRLFSANNLAADKAAARAALVIVVDAAVKADDPVALDKAVLVIVVDFALPIR